jgi:hypothetical protein
MAALAPAVAVAVAFAGCGGGDDSEQFREDYNAAVAKLSRVNTRIGQATGGAAARSNQRIAKEFSKIADTAARTRKKLSTLDPPADAKDEYQKLLSSLERGIDDLRDVAKAARQNDVKGAGEAVRSLAKSGRQITSAEDALRQAVDG